jgi:hypothetical protein
MSSILTGCKKETVVLLKSTDAPVAIFASCGSPLKWLYVILDNIVSDYWWKFKDECPR